MNDRGFRSILLAPGVRSKLRLQSSAAAWQSSRAVVSSLRPVGLCLVLSSLLCGCAVSGRNWLRGPEQGGYGFAATASMRSAALRAAAAKSARSAVERSSDVPVGGAGVARRPRLSRTVSLGTRAAPDDAGRSGGTALDSGSRMPAVPTAVVVPVERRDDVPLISDVFYPRRFHGAPPSRDFPGVRSHQRRDKPRNAERNRQSRRSAEDDSSTDTPARQRSSSKVLRTAPAWRSLFR